MFSKIDVPTSTEIIQLEKKSRTEFKIFSLSFQKKKVFFSLQFPFISGVELLSTYLLIILPALPPPPSTPPLSLAKKKHHCLVYPSPVCFVSFLTRLADVFVIFCLCIFFRFCLFSLLWEFILTNCFAYTDKCIHFMHKVGGLGRKTHACSHTQSRK